MRCIIPEHFFKTCSSTSETTTFPFSFCSPQNIDQNTGEAEISINLWALIVSGFPINTYV